MRKLVKFELKKIMKRKITIVGLLAVLSFNILLIFSTFNNMYSFDGVSRQESSLAAVALDKEIANKYSGILTDELVQRMLNDFEPKMDLHGMNAKYLYLNSTQSSVFSRFADIDGKWNGLSVADFFGNDEISIGYVNGWLSVSTYMVKITIVLAIMLIIATASIFSGEYGSTDSLILTSLYGKTKCPSSKIISAFLATTVITAFFIILNIVSALLIYGTDGLGCSILFAPQSFADTYIPFNITCGTLIKYQIILIFCGILASVGFTLFMSAVCKNSITALVTSVAVFMLPILLPMQETSSIFRLLALMPLYQLQFVSLMSIEQLSNGCLYAIMAIPASVIIAVPCCIISAKVFSNHQVL
ncbi:hypothetical protein IMSAG049_00102 [Clostridiales bacterium]|nr:hypothetical protein IMSAG049_00102 [Clostridiales bacterium]